MAELVAEVDVDAPPQRVWDRAVAWEHQQDWVPATKVRAVAGDGQGVGGRIEAWTGLGRIGFLDPMVITEWRPPYRCAVRHTGRVVRGTAALEVVELPDGRSRFVWSEWLELPLGVLGQLGWSVLHGPLRWGLRRSLRTFARQVAGS